MGGVGHPIWHVAGQQPAAMMNGGRCEDSDINLQVDDVSLLHSERAPLPPSTHLPPGKKKSHLGPFFQFSITQTPVTSHISGSANGGVASSQVVSCFFFFLLPPPPLISEATVEDASPQEPPPSAPAATSASAAAMREARNLQGIAELTGASACA